MGASARWGPQGPQVHRGTTGGTQPPWWGHRMCNAATALVPECMHGAAVLILSLACPQLANQVTAPNKRGEGPPSLPVLPGTSAVIEARTAAPCPTSAPPLPTNSGSNLQLRTQKQCTMGQRPFPFKRPLAGPTSHSQQSEAPTQELEQPDGALPAVHVANSSEREPVQVDWDAAVAQRPASSRQSKEAVRMVGRRGAGAAGKDTCVR